MICPMDEGCGVFANKIVRAFPWRGLESSLGSTATCKIPTWMEFLGKFCQGDVAYFRWLLSPLGPETKWLLVFTTVSSVDLKNFKMADQNDDSDAVAPAQEIPDNVMAATERWLK